MSRLRTSRLTIALLAQILFCLVAAPVFAEQQWGVAPAGKPEGNPDPSGGSRAIIQAAFDASNVRPEEVTDAKHRRGNVRCGSKNQHRTAASRRNRTTGVSPALAASWNGEAATRFTYGHDARAAGVHVPDVACKLLRLTVPAIQPTGPPAL